MAGLPLDPRLARILVEGSRLGCLREVLVIVAALSIVDKIKVGFGKRGPITKFVQETYMGIAEGRLPDPYGWRTAVPTGAHAGI